MEYLSRPAGDIDCTDVCHMIHAVKDEAIPIVQPHMTEKNWTKIGTLAGFYGSPDVRLHFESACPPPFTAPFHPLAVRILLLE